MRQGQIERLLKERTIVAPGEPFQKSETPPEGGVPSPVLHGFQGLWPTAIADIPLPPPHEGERPVEAIGNMARFFDLFKAIPPGARWITVRPNGPGTEGRPVLVQPAADGAYHVIGGAGGKLNYLKLTGVRSEASYK